VIFGEPIEFKQAHERFAAVLTPMLADLERLEPSQYHVLAHALLLWIGTSYEAAVQLVRVGLKSKFHSDAWTIVRSMLEAYYTLLFIIQKPVEHSKWHWQAALAELDKENQLDVELSAFEPELLERVEERKFARGQLIQAAEVSEAQLCGAVPMPPDWPQTPGSLLNVKNPDEHWTSQAREEGTRLYDLLYRMLCTKAHPSWSAIGARVASRKAQEVEAPTPWQERVVGMNITEPVMHAWLILAMAMTEVDAAVLRSAYRAQLRGLWDFLLTARPYYRDYYEPRFKTLLEQSAPAPQA
jgi:hypothetical protein